MQEPARLTWLRFTSGKAARGQTIEVDFQLRSQCTRENKISALSQKISTFHHFGLRREESFPTLNVTCPSHDPGIKVGRTCVGRGIYVPAYKRFRFEERTVTYRMYTVCYSNLVVAEGHSRSAVRSKRLLGVPVRTRASHAHWPVPRGPHSPQPFPSSRGPEVWAYASRNRRPFSASRLRQRILGFIFLQLNSVENRCDVCT
jgi:hypothetical protein